MKQSIKTRLDKLAAKIDCTGVSDCICTMKDGSTRVIHWMTAIPLLSSKEITRLQTKDPHFFHFWGDLWKEEIIFTGKSAGNR